MALDSSEGPLTRPPALTRLRWAWLLGFALLSLVGATTIVLSALPNRVNMMASRNDDEAFIPLRQLSVHEAAYLLEHAEERKAHVAVVALSDTVVSIATTHFLVPWWSGWPAVGPPTPPDGYRITRASYEGLDYSILYEVDRSALERERKRTFTDEDVEPEFTKTFEVSMAPARLRFYMLMEIGFLAVWPMGLVAGLALVLRRVRTRAVSSTIAIVWAWLCAPVVFATVYSPAFLSPDEFCQRIVVDGLAYGCFVALFITAPVTFAAAVIWGVSFFLKLLSWRPKP